MIEDLINPRYAGITILTSMILSSITTMFAISYLQHYSKSWMIGLLALVYFIFTLWMVRRDENQWLNEFNEMQKKRINKHNEKLTKK